MANSTEPDPTRGERGPPSPPNRADVRRAAIVALVLALVPLGALLGGTTDRLAVTFAGMIGLAAGLFGAIFAMARRSKLGLTAAITGIGFAFLAFWQAWSDFHLRFPFPGTRGRQLVRRGRPRVPKSEPGAHWLLEPGERIDGPAAAAEAWRHNGSTEAASVASFADLSLHLLAHGAPPRLLLDAHADAADEIEHARLCYSLARRIDGRAVGPAPFADAIAPRPPLRLEELAVEALVEGAHLEGVASEIARRLVTRARPEVRGVLETIATDEARHAAHGWDVVDFCLERGGDEVREALTGAVGRLPKQPKAVHPGSEGELEAYGVPSVELVAEAERAVETRTRHALAERLAAPPRSAAAPRDSARVTELSTSM